ncbi:MAG: FprA family A-type flavoprotein [archaeon]
MEITKNVFAVGALDRDRMLFDELIPLPDGTSYNSYLIRGSDKTALIDTVDPSKYHDLLYNLKKLGIKKIDYIIANHAEQDHSGSIPNILKDFPDAKIVTNAMCKEMLFDYLEIPDEKFIVVKEGEKLSLGTKALQFIMTPWVHWPETMVTYLEEDKILFSCDFFGSHNTNNQIAKEDKRQYDAAKRYYAEIMMPFRLPIKKNMEKISKLEILFIAPSHGPVYSNPGFIINNYNDWISENTKDEIVIAYVSMHDSTKLLAESLGKSLSDKKRKVIIFNITKSDIGEIAMALVDATTVIIASPTLVGGPHPAALNLAYIVNILKPKTKYAAILGSYGWAQGINPKLIEIMPNLKAELIDTITIKGIPKKDDYARLEALAEKINKKHTILFDGGNQNDKRN